MLIPSGHRERGISAELSRVNKVHGAFGALKKSARDLLLLLLGCRTLRFQGCGFCSYFLLLVFAFTGTPPFALSGAPPSHFEFGVRAAAPASDFSSRALARIRNPL
jgi:hypothetical protein